MARMLGYDGSVLLVAVLLILALGLAGALCAAVRSEHRRPAQATRRSR